jgi:hypothetical protein
VDNLSTVLTRYSRLGESEMRAMKKVLSERLDELRPIYKEAYEKEFTMGEVSQMAQGLLALSASSFARSLGLIV